MKIIRIAYWASTGLLCLMYLGGAFVYLTQRDMVVEAFGRFGYPAYLVTPLLIAKILGPVAILWRKSMALSDLAYAAMLFHLLFALSAHLSVRDGGYGFALAGLVLLAVSFFTQNYVRPGWSPHAGRRLGTWS